MQKSNWDTHILVGFLHQPDSLSKSSVQHTDRTTLDLNRESDECLPQLVICQSSRPGRTSIITPISEYLPTSPSKTTRKYLCYFLLLECFLVCIWGLDLGTGTGAICRFCKSKRVCYDTHLSSKSAKFRTCFVFGAIYCTGCVFMGVPLDRRLALLSAGLVLALV